ncbi:hypothetical protein F2Q70_00030380 [Brassica cretica]|nr:hypothetical protein F2Q70_00030380 [Brassica cretica]
MHEYKSPVAESKGSSNKKEKQKNKGRRKSSTNTNNSPSESPSRVGGSTRPSKRRTGKQREQSTGEGSESGTGIDLPQQNDQSLGQKKSRQKRSKGGGGRGGEPSQSAGPAKSKETDISVRAVLPCVGLGSSTGR